MPVTRQLSRSVDSFPVAIDRWKFDRLFQNSEVGVVFDPSDRSTLFQEAAGATPVTAATQPVGLILDKSQGLAIGTQLMSPETENFTQLPTQMTVVGLDVTITGGRIRGTLPSNNTFRRFDVIIPTVAGRTYRIDYAGESNAGIAPGGWANTVGSGAPVVPPGNFSQTYRVTATSTSMTVRFYPRSTSGTADSQLAGDYIEFSSFSIREIAGRHATQVTAGSRPTYGVIPKVGRRNLINNTENFMVTPWAISGGTTLMSREMEPGGVNGLPAVRLTAVNNISGTYFISHTSFSTIAEQRYTLRVTLKDISNGQARVIFGAPTSSQVRARFDLTTGARISQNTSSGTVHRSGNWTSQANPDGSYTIQATVWTTDSSSGQIAVYLSINDVTAAVQAIGNAILISAPSFEVGEVATPYQRVNTTFDITEPGVPSCHYLQFDGVDDWLSTQAINFTATDKTTISLGVRKLSDASQGMIAELSSNFNSNAGAWYMATSTTTGYASSSRGSTTPVAGNAAISDPIYVAPVTNFVVATHDITAAFSALRVNGTANGVIGTATKGTGNFGNYPIFIGRRGGSSLPFNGQLFGLVVRNTLDVSSETAQTEKLIARKTTGAYDLDAEGYINRVQAADGLMLPVSVREAINQFVINCKLDGTWSLIKAMCFLAGPRTLNGALVPLIGVGPTSFNFVSGDYDMKTGLKGDAATKYLNTNRNGDAEAQNNNSYWVFETESPSVASLVMGNSGNAGTAGQILIQRAGMSISTRNKTGTATSSSESDTNNLIGIYRNNSSNYQVVTGQNTTQINIASNGNLADFMRVFSRNNVNFSDARLSAYGIGDAFDLRILDNRLKTYMAAIDTASY